MTSTQSSNNSCPNCGEVLRGDGHTWVIHCEHTQEDISNYEPDGGPLYCIPPKEKE